MEKFGVDFIYGKAVTDIAYPSVYTGSEQRESDEIFVCSGADFETLYPSLFAATPVTRCKLQMIRVSAQPGNERIGAALCGPLSLMHYPAFKVASSLGALSRRYHQEYAEYLKWGIHVMVAQNEAGELTIGDSHEYGLTPDPFDKQLINQLILDYLKKFASLKDETVIETWHGVYPKLTNGQSYFVSEPEKHVHVINGLGGAGMTLSFGLCDQLVGKELQLQSNIVV